MVRLKKKPTLFHAIALGSLLILTAGGVLYALDPPSQVSSHTEGQLRQQFDQWLKAPKAYRDLALTEAKTFPEGRLYPFVFPAIAYVNAALKGSITKEQAAEQTAKLIDLAIPLVAKEVAAPEGDLLQLKDYQKHATFLGTLNLALGYDALLQEENRYPELHRHVSKLLLEALRVAKGGPIERFFCQVACPALFPAILLEVANCPSRSFSWPTWIESKPNCSMKNT